MLTAALLVVTAGCTPSISTGSTGTVSLPPVSSRAVSPTTTVRSSPVPVTPDGMVTGPGVTDTAISLGLLIGTGLDRGFSQGVRLWQQSINASGGICGRTVDIRTGTGDPEADYRQLVRSVVGFLDLTRDSGRSALAASASADQVPVLSVSGSSTDLTADGPVVLGATDDIKVINALAYLASTNAIADHATVGVLVGEGDGPANGLAGARWWAARAGVTLEVRSGPAPSLTGWGSAGTVLALTGSATVTELLRVSPASLKVVTTLDGYDPAAFRPSDKGRLLLTVSTPAFGSDHPAAAAVAKAFTGAGPTAPGPRLLAGYALAAGWGRLLAKACTDRSLTRSGVHAAMTEVGPAGVDSLFGPSDPGLVVGQRLPATRVSSMALADPAAPAGLTPLNWAQAAAGIADYSPGR